MNVLVLGNGFDLNYSLPTKYINFLHTLEYLSTAEIGCIKTVADVFKSPKLHAQDKDIQISYEKYAQEYSAVLLNKDTVAKLSDLARNNLWLKYFLQSLCQDIGWIDFEKEISTVLSCFRDFLQNTDIKYDAVKLPVSAIDKYILSKFNFFSKKAGRNSLPPALYIFNDEYTVSYPYGSDNKIIDVEKIINELELHLIALSDGLKIYLCCFVDQVVRELMKANKLERLLMFHGTNQVISFNYTNTYETVYGQNNVYHIHGNVDASIILGVNPDDSDERSSIDTTFLRFKKYYQRVALGTDAEYLRWLQEIKESHSHPGYDPISLLVMGHSLDVTDSDIIVELFELASDITVLYYNDSSKASLIRNLVAIFGKNKFYQLRTQKQLIFMPQSSDFSDFAKRKAETSKHPLERYAETLEYFNKQF